jgi:hypothetical protein
LANACPEPPQGILEAIMVALDIVAAFLPAHLGVAIYQASESGRVAIRNYSTLFDFSKIF